LVVSALSLGKQIKLRVKSHSVETRDKNKKKNGKMRMKDRSTQWLETKESFWKKRRKHHMKLKFALCSV